MQKTYSALLKCGENMKPYSQPLAWQILRIVGSQIEIEKIFSFVCILTNLKYYQI
jgi:hypothetical protein